MLIDDRDPWGKIIGPIKYRVATCKDKLGEYDEALKNYKYFYTIYKDCDHFYQDNVEHARQRITELEKSSY